MPNRKGGEGVEKQCSGGGGWMPIRHSRVGTKFRLKMNLEFLDLKGISKLKQ